MVRSEVFSDLEKKLGKDKSDKLRKEFDTELQIRYKEVKEAFVGSPTLYEKIYLEKLTERNLLIEYSMAVIRNYMPDVYQKEDPKQGRLWNE